MPTAITARAVVSPSAASRLEVARAWLRAQPRDREIVVVGSTNDAAAELARSALDDADAAGAKGAARFGCHRTTFARLAGTLAAEALARRGLVAASQLAREAVCAHIVLGAKGGDLGRFEPLRRSPGLPRALARTLQELRLEAIDSDELEDRDLGRLMCAYDESLRARGLADRATALEAAIEAARGPARHDLLDRPTAFLDVAIGTRLERELVRAIVARAGDAVLLVPEGDERTLAQLRAIGVAEERAPELGSPLEPLQARLFTRDAKQGADVRAKDAVRILSAPGESRECVELAREILREAERGTPFDRMAVLLRAPEQYRAHLEEALRRAEIPAHFARGAVRPNPAGRAFVALLACAAEGLRASRFAEYLSLGEIPDAAEGGAPPCAIAATDRWVAPDDELAPDALLRNAPPSDEAAPREPVADPEVQAVVGGTLRAPRLWERLLVDAAVIGGLDRWKRRLEGLARELELDLAYDEEKNGALHAARLRRSIAGLEALSRFALPLLADLDALPKEATWGVWIERLGALATRALRNPDGVLATLVELNPMAEVSGVTLAEVRLVLERRLCDAVNPPAGRRYGRVYVASIEEARGLDFDVVLVPGLAERMFPQKVIEDPILPDPRRAAFEGRLRTNADRSTAERLALRLALGSAKKRVIVSYPRLDADRGRPRTPSFYGLEVLHATEGALGGFEDFARRAASVGDARIGWPAPRERADAIDEAEHDLALLESILRRPESETEGMARYLLGANPHLARALRARWMRWSTKKWTAADGLVDPAPAARAALAKHALESRSFSPTALQNFAACPYRFLLQAIHRLSPREEPAALEELDPLQRGTLVHEVQFELYCALRDERLLPVTERTLPRAQEILDRIVREVAARHEDALCPAIDRVWEDGILSIAADLTQALRKTAEDPSWKPVHFELSFGLKERRAADPNSREEAVAIDCGLQLRGSIDLIERHASGELRATDYKTGKVRAKKNTVIGGGEILQPVLYALVLEKIFPNAKVFGGRLWYCTAAGEFTATEVQLDDEARGAARLVAETVRAALAQGFLPAAPKEGACEYCDYDVICGPYEETRTKRKRQDRLQGLVELRNRR
jgi:RecB family exonuclease